MWNLGALLFGHLTRNCRCSHCPGINSNYALYSDGFCASNPQPPPAVAPPSLSTHTHAVLTHISRFSLPPTSHPVLSLPLCHWWTHLATGALCSHYEWTYRNMHIQAWRRRKRKKKKEEEVFLVCASSAIHELKQFCTLSKVKLFLQVNYISNDFCNCDTLWKIPILGKHLFRLVSHNHLKDAINSHFYHIILDGDKRNKNLKSPVTTSNDLIAIFNMSLRLKRLRVSSLCWLKSERKLHILPSNNVNTCICTGGHLTGMNGSATRRPPRILNWKRALVRNSGVY